MSLWFILASGPSMTREDAGAVRGRGVVVAINNTIQIAPWADIHYACDVKWWRRYWLLPEVQAFKGQRYCLDTGETAPAGVDPLPWRDAEGLGRKRIHAGGFSGYQAINLAYLKGARTIVLLGYDMTGGHWHQDHSATLGNPNEAVFVTFRSKMLRLARDLEAEGVRVINASRKTTLTCFQRLSLAVSLTESGASRPSARKGIQ